jgi:hypothetical protein
VDEEEFAERMAAALAEREGAVAAAAFLQLLADAMKAKATDAKARAVALAERHKVEKITGKHDGTEIGTLSRNRESVQWSVDEDGQMEPGGDLYAWIEEHHPSWIDVHPEETITRTIPERRMVNHARMVELCETLTKDHVDPVTGEKVPGLRRHVEPGSWVLRKDRAAKALVAQAVDAMMERQLPGLREIEGGR